MKKLLLLILVASSLGLTACTKQIQRFWGDSPTSEEQQRKDYPWLFAPSKLDPHTPEFCKQFPQDCHDAGTPGY